MKNETATEQNKSVTAVTIKHQGRQVTITADHVRDYLCPLASLPEIGLFLATCESLSLNPFAKEIYLIKYEQGKAANIVISIDAYLKAAEADPAYDGHVAGIILKRDPPELREGEFLLEEERPRLIGGWAKVYRKDRRQPSYSAVNLNAYRKYTREGRATEFWADNKCPMMIRKVALHHALKEAFPQLAGLSTTAEFEEVPEGELPPAFQKNGQPDWTPLWAKITNELHLPPDEVHDHFKVNSLKDLIAKGWTMDDIWLALLAYQQGKALQPTTPSSPFTGEEPPGLRTTVLSPEKEEASASPLAPVGPEHSVHDELVKAWSIVKSSVAKLNPTDKQIARWFLHYGLEVNLSDFDKDLPPPQVTSELLSKFQTSLDTYQPPKGKAARSAGARAPARDPSSIKSIDGLMAACLADFNLTEPQVLAEVNLTSRSSIISPKGIYMAIAAGRQQP